MDLYHRKSYKCFFLSEGKIRLRNVKETLKRIGPSTDPRDSFHNFCSHCTKDEVFNEDFCSKCDQIRRKLQIWSNLLKKSLRDNFFCVQCKKLKAVSILILSQWLVK